MIETYMAIDIVTMTRRTVTPATENMMIRSLDLHGKALTSEMKLLR